MWRLPFLSLRYCDEAFALQVNVEAYVRTISGEETQLRCM